MLKITLPERNGKTVGTWVGANAVICSGERGTLPPPEPEPGGNCDTPARTKLANAGDE